MGLEFQFFKMKKERWLVATAAVLRPLSGWETLTRDISCAFHHHKSNKSSLCRNRLMFSDGKNLNLASRDLPFASPYRVIGGKWGPLVVLLGSSKWSRYFSSCWISFSRAENPLPPVCLSPFLPSLLPDIFIKYLPYMPLNSARQWLRR